MQKNHVMDRLIAAVEQKQNPSVLGLDTKIEYLPDYETLQNEAQGKSAEEILKLCAQAIVRYNTQLIDALSDSIPAVKIQVAYYEIYGEHGMRAFRETIDYARGKDLIVMADVKRGDIGATAEAYAQAYLGGVRLGESRARGFQPDIMTVNPYFGSDGILPFTQACASNGKGIFVLVKTSNPSCGELQDLLCEGKPFYEHVADKVKLWGADQIGDFGYSAIGAVVGATYAQQGAALRQNMPYTYFLLPGYGAQGATARDLAGCFDSKGHGAIVNASRSILCAYRKCPDLSHEDAALREALAMKKDLLASLGGKIG